MRFNSMPRMMANQIEDYMYSVDVGTKLSTYCIRGSDKWILVFSFSKDGNANEIVMSSQREKTRTFATLETARKACSFAPSMTVMGI